MEEMSSTQEQHEKDTRTTFNDNDKLMKDMWSQFEQKINVVERRLINEAHKHTDMAISKLRSQTQSQLTLSGQKSDSMMKKLSHKMLMDTKKKINLDPKSSTSLNPLS